MPGGRPPLFETPEELERKIEGYFGFFKDKITITGLAFYLGFESRQSFYDYEKREEFSYIIRRARLRVEMAYEESLQTKYCQGSIFALKNMGWKDKHEVEQSGSVKVDFNGIQILKPDGPNPEV